VYVLLECLLLCFRGRHRLQ